MQITYNNLIRACSKILDSQRACRYYGSRVDGNMSQVTGAFCFSYFSYICIYIIQSEGIQSVRIFLPKRATKAPKFPNLDEIWRGLSLSNRESLRIRFQFPKHLVSLVTSAKCPKITKIKKIRRKNPGIKNVVALSLKTSECQTATTGGFYSQDICGSCWRGIQFFINSTAEPGGNDKKIGAVLSAKQPSHSIWRDTNSL